MQLYRCAYCAYLIHLLLQDQGSVTAGKEPRGEAISIWCAMWSHAGDGRPLVSELICLFNAKPAGKVLDTPHTPPSLSSPSLVTAASCWRGTAALTCNGLQEGFSTRQRNPCPPLPPTQAQFNMLRAYRRQQSTPEACTGLVFAVTA